MKKTVAALLLLSLLATLIVCAGCGEKEAQEGGTAKQIPVEEDKGAVTPKPEEERDGLPPAAAPSEEELGAPIYPGAVFVPGSGEVQTYSTSGHIVTAATVQFTTNDAFDDVIAFYTEKLGKSSGTLATRQNMLMEASWVAKWEDWEDVYPGTVVVTREDAEVRIQIAPPVDDK